MAVMFLIKFSFFLLLFVLCPLYSGSRSRCSAQKTGSAQQTGAAMAPRSSLESDEVYALANVVYYSGLMPRPTISYSFCDDQLSFSSITITCSSITGTDNERHITGITMENVRLNGYIHSDITKLTYLETLDLSNNQLHDSIPYNLGDLSHLTSLYLKQNFLTGIIPPSLGNLNSLEYLSLYFNKLSGEIPHQLGKLSQLQILSLDDNELNGTLPKELGNLRNLRSLWLTSNYLTGEVPKEYEQLESLEVFAVGGNNMSGPIPPSLRTGPNLTRLQVSDLKSTGFAFPNSSNLPSIETLDLSFNKLTGRIPDSFEHLNLETMLLTGNKLNGKIPDWINGTITRMGTSPSQIIDDHCHGKNSQYHSLFINAGGEDANIGGKHYDADNISSNTFYVDPTKRWAYVCSGDFLSTTANSSDYIRNNTCGVSSPEATLYDKARICPQSLTYYGFCLQKGNYTVELDFAEIVFSKDEDYSSLGKRVFDVYIQGTRVLEDFNIKKEAGIPNKGCTKSFKGNKVDHNLLEIRLFWAGKGSLYNPPALNGPLISAISVTPVRLLLLSTTIYSDFKIGVLSTKWIVGIVIAVVSALVLASLLLWAFMWRMGWVGDRELNNTTVKIREKEYSLKEVIVATGNFGPQNEIGPDGLHGYTPGSGETCCRKEVTSRHKAV
ncbi:hypothetical protein Pint_09500 [Pistacia integerrima]|uniref:Uncharacterized protein n=1 Tax=Pistacia integerrima TaxID=434235 RepID=A0ACC0XHN1_9ROSI|nr:hypothetical protein Pint_09500 [Pistacia integerrima]